MTTADFRSLTEETLFIATRSVRNSTHDLGTIEAGERVFFRANREADVGEPDGTFTLCYENGQPTNGSEYREFADWQSVRAFVESFGLVRDAAE